MSYKKKEHYGRIPKKRVYTRKPGPAVREDAFRVTVSVRMTRELHERILERLKEDGKTLSEVFRVFSEQYVARVPNVVRRGGIVGEYN